LRIFLTGNQVSESKGNMAKAIAYRVFQTSEFVFFRNVLKVGKLKYASLGFSKGRYFKRRKNF
jgi:hypothetical protein